MNSLNIYSFVYTFFLSVVHDKTILCDFIITAVALWLNAFTTLNKRKIRIKDKMKYTKNTKDTKCEKQQKK